MLEISLCYRDAGFSTVSTSSHSATDAIVAIATAVISIAPRSFYYPTYTSGASRDQSQYSLSADLTQTGLLEAAAAMHSM